MNQQGYYRFPTVFEDHVVFTCEDDLWRVPLGGGHAERITASTGLITDARYSPDGSLLAYTGRTEGSMEVYVMDAAGGPEQRVTYLGHQTRCVGWNPINQHILFTSNVYKAFARSFSVYSTGPDGADQTRLHVGYANSIAIHPDGPVVVGRNTSDPARWKRYRGGRVGVLWIDRLGNGMFEKLTNLNGNFDCPMWIGDRVYFISDHEGYGNIYSCLPDGSDIQRHSSHTEYYVRNASTDGNTIVYHAGGDIYALDSSSSQPRMVDISFRSSRTQVNRKFVSALQYLESAELHPDGHSLVVNSRGKTFTMGNWEGPVLQYGKQQGVRYKHSAWLPDKERIMTISDESGEERIEIYHADPLIEPTRLDHLDIGTVVGVEVSPKEDKVLISNSRFELLLVDLQEQTVSVIERNQFRMIAGMSWSPDGKWVAYAAGSTRGTVSIRLYNLVNGEAHQITRPEFRDVNPVFDPEGRYLYFISYRTLNPVYDTIYFDLSFPRAMRPYLIPLQRSTESPFVPTIRKPKPKPGTAKPDANGSPTTGEDAEEKQSVAPTVLIDLEGIEDRIIAFPVPEGTYGQIIPFKTRVFFTSYPVMGSLEENEGQQQAPRGVLLSYDFDNLESKVVLQGVDFVSRASGAPVILYRSGKRIRIIPAQNLLVPQQGQPETSDGFTRNSGWIDLSRIKLLVEQAVEFKQMYSEVWRLQRDNFWDENMSGIDWQAAGKRYQILLDRIGTRAEFSDIVWELQGELGTSHAYEYGGDYRPEPPYKQGFLGCEYEFDAENDGYRITHLIRGDSWNERTISPLLRPGLNVQEGDVIVAINGQRLSRTLPPEKTLVNQAGAEIRVTLKSGQETRNISVRAMESEMRARYREWVAQNKRKVHEATNGQVGYLHIPDMKANGYAEFHRHYFAEIDRGGLIIDVRNNGGGNVSQLLLEKLLRKRVAYNLPRRGDLRPYPFDSPAGPVVAITNEYAGSDGDIFSHSFKLLGVGTLIGKRTWGGVIGIWPRHPLVDGSVTTQPEFSFWFTDVGYKVENYGTDPDIEVDIAPHDFAAGTDTQLERAIAEVMKQMEIRPVTEPVFGRKPNLAPPAGLS